MVVAMTEVPHLRPPDRSHGLLKALSDWVGWRRSLKPVDSVWLRDWEPVGFVRELAGGLSQSAVSRDQCSQILPEPLPPRKCWN